MNPWVYSYIFLFIFSQAHAQTGSLSGRITSEGKPGEFINVLLIGTTYGATTDATGAFAIKNIPVGNYEVQFSGIGYRMVKRKIFISEGVTINQDLHENVSQLNEVGGDRHDEGGN